MTIPDRNSLRARPKAKAKPAGKSKGPDSVAPPAPAEAETSPLDGPDAPSAAGGRRRKLTPDEVRGMAIARSPGRKGGTNGRV
jgi:hypothetical protein